MIERIEEGPVGRPEVLGERLLAGDRAPQRHHVDAVADEVTAGELGLSGDRNA